MADYIDWPAGGTTTYRYWFLDTPSIASSIKAEPGNYMFVKPVKDGWLPVYIGIADKLNERMPGHERWAEAIRLGATKILAHIQHDRTKRLAEEQTLIGYWNPPLNTQHRRQGGLLGG